MAFGAAWRTIAATETDSDSPLTQFLADAWRLNDQFLYDWIGGNFTPAVDHDHNGTNSKTVDLSSVLAADHQQFVVAPAGAGWSVATGALSFTPTAVLVHWLFDQTDPTMGWGMARGTAAGDQNGISQVFDSTGIINNLSIDANDIMGWSSTAGPASTNLSFATEQARVTVFDATGVTIATQSGSWGASNLYINMLVWGG
jgi:hypothetical protein